MTQSSNIDPIRRPIPFTLMDNPLALAGAFLSPAVLFVTRSKTRPV